METTLEVVEGMQFDRGYLSPTSSPTPNAWNASSKTCASSSRKENQLHEGPAPVARARTAKMGKPLLIVA